MISSYIQVDHFEHFFFFDKLENLADILKPIINYFQLRDF